MIKYQLKIKFKFMFYYLLGLLTLGGILLFAYLNEKLIEVSITAVCFFIFRPLYDKQYHCKTLIKCSIVSFIVFCIVSCIEVDKSVSILLSVVLAFLITYLSSLVKDYIDLKTLAKTPVIKALSNLTLDELLILLPDIDNEIIKIVYGYLHKSRETTAISYAYANHISEATLFRYLKQVRKAYHDRTTN